MSDTKGRYPLATADGQSVPLDVVRPHGFLIKAVGATASAAISVPTGIDLMSVFCSQDTIIKFAAASPVAAIPADGVLATDAFYLPRNQLITLSPPIDKRLFSVIAVSTAGNFVAQFLENWTGLSLSSQAIRR